MGFSYKKNCGRLPDISKIAFGEVPAAVLFFAFFSDKTHPLPFCSGGQYLFCRLVNVSF